MPSCPRNNRRTGRPSVAAWRGFEKYRLKRSNPSPNHRIEGILRDKSRSRLSELFLEKSCPDPLHSREGIIPAQINPLRPNLSSHLKHSRTEKLGLAVSARPTYTASVLKNHLGSRRNGGPIPDLISLETFPSGKNINGLAAFVFLFGNVPG